MGKEGQSIMKKRKLDPKIIRIGDKVRIANPEFFDGCLYENNIRTKTAEVIEKHGNEIVNFICRLAGITQQTDVIKLMAERNPIDDIAIKKIAKVIAYEIVAKGKKTGNAKKIYTRLCEDERDLVYKVASVRYVHTGIYNEGSCWRSGGYDDPEEWESIPAFLSDIKVHKILSLDFNKGKYLQDQFQHTWHSTDDLIEIEAKNVEKVFEPMEEES
jgi:hypothetical protein